MPIRPVLLVPDARLKQPCAPVEQFDRELHVLVADLEETMRSNPGCVGIAACQIGVLKRVAIVDTTVHKKHSAQSQGRMILVNPVITRRGGERMGREGCLSLPDFTANVRRAMDVTVQFQDEHGITRTVHSTDFEAVALQHEVDHLDGILFLDRVANVTTDVFPRKKK
ncbi:MAG TPA: peptide deformylase [Abditibacteriaceae bacterium]|jgi:peptide deformylase